MNPVLEATTKRRAKLQAKLESIVNGASQRSDQLLTDQESRDFEDTAIKIARCDRDIKGLKAGDKRLGAAAAAQADGGKRGKGGAVIRRQVMTYDRHGENGYFRDLAYIAAASKDTSYSGLAAEARERLAQHGKEVEIEARSSKKLAARLREIRQTPYSLEQRVTPNTTAGTGGEMVPPLWLVSQYVPFLRPTRTFANRVTMNPLPPGIDVINIPQGHSRICDRHPDGAEHGGHFGRLPDGDRVGEREHDRRPGSTSASSCWSSPRWRSAWTGSSSTTSAVTTTSAWMSRCSSGPVSAVSI